MEDNESDMSLQDNKQKVYLTVPGRLCLFGEHTDWVSEYRRMNPNIPPGKAIVCLVDMQITAIAEISNFVCFSAEMNGRQYAVQCELSTASIEKAIIDNPIFAYVLSTCSSMINRFGVGGIDIKIISNTLPVKKGLSSSAAICILVARAFNRVYELNMPVEEEVEIAYISERNINSMCGKMDHIVAYSNTLSLMEFELDKTIITSLSATCDIYMVWIDLKYEKDTKRILGDLNKCYPFPDNKISTDVQEAFGENSLMIVDSALHLIREGDNKGLGELMTSAYNLFSKKILPASSALYSPRLDRVLKDPSVISNIFGGKGVGSLGDGSVQAIAKNKDSQRKLCDYLNSMPNVYAAYPVTIRR